MADTNNDDQNRVLIAPQQQTPPPIITPQAQSNMWDWVRRNRIAVIIGIIILIALIWWFCMRKGKDANGANVSTNITIPPGQSTTVSKQPESLRLTKVRANGNMY